MFSVERQGAVDVITGSDPIAGEHVDKFAEHLETCLKSGQPMVVVDMTRVALLDSKGLETLLDYSEQFAEFGGELRFCGVNDLCADIFEATGLTQSFEFFAAHKEAVGSFYPMTATLEHPQHSTVGGTSKRRLLGQSLLGANLISAEQLDQALDFQRESGKRIGEALLELGLVSEDQLLPILAETMQVQGVRLRDGLVDPLAARLIPRELAERWNCIALYKVRSTLTVAMEDPRDLTIIDELERICELRVRPVLAIGATIGKLLSRCYDEDFEVDTVTADLDQSAVELQDDIASVDLSTIESLVDGSPVINLVNYLVLQALRKNASDIHIEPSKRTSIVRYRIDGQLVEVLRPRRDIHPAIVSRIKVMGKMDIAEHREPQDGRCQVIVEGKQIDLRISTLPTVLGEKVVLRVLDKSRLSFDLEQLGMPTHTLDAVKGLLARPYGLVLATGPTGSGKTTTLYSALELVKSVHLNIVTVEDPVEYQIELVNQVQADRSRALSFAEALRSILRQDPDVIMVGEIRDSETAKVAVQSALTGHLVLSTLHTNDSAGAITRLVDMGVDHYKVAAALVGVIAQRLLRTICPKCRSVYSPSEEQLRVVGYQGDKRRTFARGEGCAECFDTGFQGRVGIYEVMTAVQPLRQLIGECADEDTIREWYLNHGGRSLLRAAMDVAMEEKTSLDEVMRVAYFE